MIHFSLNLFKVLKNLSHWICRLGSTKAEYTSPKNSLFYADPFSKSVFGLKLRVIFFLISQKIFNCYSSWSISFIYIYIYFYIFISYLYLFRQYICELIKTNNTLLKLTSQSPGTAVTSKQSEPEPEPEPSNMDSSSSDTDPGIWKWNMQRQYEKKFQCINNSSCVSPDGPFTTLHSNYSWK